VTNALLLATATDGFLRYAIVHGRSGTPMPAFERQLSPRQIGDVTRFLRSQTRTVKDERPVGEVPKVFGDLVVHPRGPEPKFPALRDGRYLAVDELKKAYEAEARMVILDARPASDWLRTHIPGALPVPYYDSEKMIAQLPRDGTWIVTYCGCPHAASDQVTNMLRARGFKKTAVVDEGIFVWTERGYPVTYGSSSSGRAAKGR
jgi:cytochrome c oxidase cbb3-type subunit 3